MKKVFSNLDKPLLLLTIIYAIFGLIMIFSASSVSSVLRYNVSPYYFFTKQFIILLASFFVGFFIILKFPTSKYKYFIPLLVLGITVALGGLYVYGKIAGGAQSWYNLGFFNLQPSEFAKSILIIYMAVFYSHQQKKKNVEAFTYLIPLAVAALICGLVVMQPDLGGAAIIAGIAFMIFISVPMGKDNKQRILKIVGIGLIIAAIVFLYNAKSFLSSSQLSRLEFQNPCSRYVEPTGYQVCNGFIAINNGSLLGVGLGNSTQKYLYLPEAHTDFIYPIIVEELGLLFGILVLVGYGIILFRILKIAKNSETLRGSIICYGTFWYLLFHVIVNLLGILALIPLTGVPLPLLSYGGSFNINVVIMLFIIQRIAIENVNLKNKREIERI